MAGTIIVDTINSSVSSTPPVFQANGTQIGTLCRAWVNFNGTGTVAINASFNVSSITDNGTGDYTVNFTTALPDANYAVLGTNVTPADANGVATLAIRTASGFGSAPTLKTTTQVQLINHRESNYDTANANVSIFR